MMAGYLRLIVMKTLHNKKLSGYGLIKQIERDTGTASAPSTRFLKSC